MMPLKPLFPDTTDIPKPETKGSAVKTFISGIPSAAEAGMNAYASEYNRKLPALNADNLYLAAKNAGLPNAEILRTVAYYDLNKALEMAKVAMDAEETKKQQSSWAEEIQNLIKEAEASIPDGETIKNADELRRKNIKNKALERIAISKSDDERKFFSENLKPYLEEKDPTYGKVNFSEKDNFINSVSKATEAYNALHVLSKAGEELYQITEGAQNRSGKTVSEYLGGQIGGLYRFLSTIPDWMRFLGAGFKHLTESPLLKTVGDKVTKFFSGEDEVEKILKSEEERKNFQARIQSQYGANSTQAILEAIEAVRFVVLNSMFAWIKSITGAAMSEGERRNYLEALALGSNPAGTIRYIEGLLVKAYRENARQAEFWRDSAQQTNPLVSDMFNKYLVIETPEGPVSLSATAKLPDLSALHTIMSQSKPQSSGTQQKGGVSTTKGAKGANTTQKGGSSGKQQSPAGANQPSVQDRHERNRRLRERAYQQYLERQKAGKK